MTGPAAIALFLYRRPGHTRQVVEALRANRLATTSDLYVFCDGAKGDADQEDVGRVQEAAARILGFRSVSVRRRDRNQGLARSIIDGVSTVLAAHSRVVVVEDDVVTSPRALDYFNTMLERFEPFPAVSSVSGFAYPPELLPIPADYLYDVFFTPRIKSWGWATWRDRWHTMDWSHRGVDELLADTSARARFQVGGDDLVDLLRLQQTGRIDSWAIRWDYRQFTRGTVSVHPRWGCVQCIGLDGSGTHCAAGGWPGQAGTLVDLVRWHLPADVRTDARILAAYRALYRGQPRPSLLHRLARRTLPWRPLRRLAAR